MKKTLASLAALATILFVSVPAFAQSVCVDSPENPTLVLAGLAAGAYTLSQLNIHFRARRAAALRRAV